MAVRGPWAAVVLAAAMFLCAATAAEGQTSPSRCSILKAGVRCAKGDPGVRCFADPCAGKCAADPDAQCVANYCKKPFTYQGKQYGPCAAIWVNPRTCQEVSCEQPCPPLKKDGSLQCPAGDSGMTCASGNPCAFTTCLTGTTCTPNYCSTPVDVNGSAIEPCMAVCIDNSKCAA